jgi:hypothetical protein
LSEVNPPKKGRRQFASLLAVFLLVSSLGAVVIYKTETPQPLTKSQVAAYLSCDGPQNKTGCDIHIPLQVNLALNITVYASATNHTKVGGTYQPHDLILNNFYQWLIVALDNAQSTLTLTTSGIKNTAGTTENMVVWGSTPCSSSPYCINYASSGEGGQIEVGTSSTAATRADMNLGSPFQSYFDTNAVCLTGSTDSVVVTGSENANAGGTITESGLFMQNALGGNGYFILAHDIFSGVVVSGGNTITVQYTWSLNNAGFNYNLCELLAAYWTQPNGSNNLIKTPNSLMVFYDTQGRNVTWVPSCNPSGSYASVFVAPLASSSPTSSACATFALGDTNNAMQIAIGTGSAAFTPTTRSLTSYYAENYITNTNYDSAGNAYETANILLATGATISEAAIYLTLPKGCIGYSPNHGGAGGACITSYGSDTIMLLAATFTGVVVPNGQSIGITFQESG